MAKAERPLLPLASAVEVGDARAERVAPVAARLPASTRARSRVGKHGFGFHHAPALAAARGAAFSGF